MGIEADNKYVEEQMAEIVRLENLEHARKAFEANEISAEELTNLENEEPLYSSPSKRETLGVNTTKNMFINSIYNWLIATLKKVGNGDYVDTFKIDGSSIICNLPDNYFARYSIPAGTKIEMKFITKKG